jgi:ABC-type Mn2+/Zn2+ transport system ATPase subunit
MVLAATWRQARRVSPLTPARPGAQVAYPLQHRRTPRAERNGKIHDVLELVGLGAYADRPVVQLSGGQMQRVALARSLATLLRASRTRAIRAHRRSTNLRC